MPKKILIIEDDKDVSSLLESRLKTEGYDIIKADNGIDGYETAKSQKPDLIITDVMLPKTDGYHLCRMLKYDDKYKSIPVMMLTAKGEDEDEVIGKGVGADCYMTKPFDGRILIEKVQRLLDSSS